MRLCHVKVVLVVPLLLCGCTVGPDYHAPHPSIEKTFVPGSRPAASQPSVITSAPMPAAKWWQVLHDPLLDKLIEQTAASNLDVKIAQARVRQSRAELAYAAGGQYPAANADVAYS